MKSRAAGRKGEQGKSREEKRPIQTADEGVGPLYQRDFILVLAGSLCTPEEVLEKIRTDFPAFSPDALARFTRPPDSTGPLQLGDTMHVHIRGGGHAGVVVVHLDSRSLTLRTQEGHMEAGRVTFGSYYDREGRLVLRIRSRSTIRDPVRFTAYQLFGKYAQAAIWSTYLKRLAGACGGEQIGDVLVTMEAAPELPADREKLPEPTFEALDEAA